MNRLIHVFSALILLVMLLSNKGGRATQAGEGSTGAPGESVYCKNCHNANILVAVDLYMLDGKDTVSTYEPGKPYSMHVIVRSTGGPVPKGYGFQLVGLVAPAKQSGPDIKTLSSGGANVKTATASSTKRLYAEHNGNSSAGTFIVKWQAPAAGSGPVTFYAAGMGNNANNDSSGDGASKNSLQVNEKVPSAVSGETTDTDIRIYPNPSQGIFFASGKDLEQVRSYSVFDLMGRSCLSREHVPGTSIDIGGLQDGIYFLQWKDVSGKALRTHKLVKRGERP